MPTASDNIPALPVHLNGSSPAWNQWRDKRLQLASATNDSVDIASHSDITATTLAKICEHVAKRGYARFQIDGDNAAVQRKTLHRLLGLLQLKAHDKGVIRTDDGLSLLRDHGASDQAKFVPYSNRHLNWHTDGYYNAPEQSLRCFVLHCLQPATEGGELIMLDPELLLIELYRRDARLVTLLSHPECLCLPANTDRHGHSRPDRYAAVLAAHSDGTLAMRYTTRSRNIHFRNSETKLAMQQLQAIIDSCRQWHIRLRLQAGQGILCRNLLHCRSEFSDPADAPGRQILRGRFTTMPHNPKGQ